MDEVRLKKANRVLDEIKKLRLRLDQWEMYNPASTISDHEFDEGYVSEFWIPSGGITEGKLEDLKQDCCNTLRLALQLAQEEFEKL